jgi:hypothetical protein
MFNECGKVDGMKLGRETEVVHGENPAQYLIHKSNMA